jgi:hypothetical protein
MHAPLSKREHVSWLHEMLPVKSGTILVAVLLVLIAQLTHRCADAQTLYGSIVGTVTDSSGAVIPDATVTATNVSTNETRSGLTNDKGFYTLSTVPAGNYTVSVSKKGFQTFQATGIDVVINTTARVDASLAVGAESQTISVNSTTACWKRIVSTSMATSVQRNWRICLSPPAHIRGSSDFYPV